MEKEPNEKKGNLYICESKDLSQGSFIVSSKKENKYCKIFSGNLTDYCDSLFAAAIIKEKQLEGIDVYLILNADDAKYYDEQGD